MFSCRKESFVALFLLLSIASLNALAPTFYSKGSAIKISDTSILRVENQFTNAGGTVARDSTATISSPASVNLIFDNGYYSVDNSTTFLSSNLDIANNDVVLDAGQTLQVAGGNQPNAVTIKGAGNKIEGTSRLTSDVTLEDGSADLTFDLPNKLGVDVILNAGTVKLDNDLSFADAKTFTGTGTLNLSGYRLSFGATPLTFSTVINWQNAADITLNSLTTLTSTWNFAGTSILQGNGNILDISGAGTLALAAGATLTMTDLYLKGLGGGAITFVDATSILRLTNVTIELDDDETLTNGTIHADTPTTIITRDKVLTIGNGATLNVNGITLWYDTLTFADASNVTTGGTGAITLNSNGRVERVLDYADIGASAAAINTIDTNLANLHFSSNITLTYDLFLSDDHTLQFHGDSIVDGNGHIIRLSGKKSNQIIVDAGFTVTATNVVLENLSPDHISLGAGSDWTFGDGSKTGLLDEENLTSTWKFSGTALLYGNGRVLDLDPTGQLFVTDTANLTLENLVLQGLTANRLYCGYSATTTGSLTFKDVKMVLPATWNFQFGSILFSGQNQVAGAGTFSYESAFTSTIDSNSTLRLADGLTFAYDPAASIEPATASQLNLAFVDNSSRLTLDGVTLDISDKGMQLIKGTLELFKENIIDSAAVSPNYEDGLIFGNGTFNDDLRLLINPEASLNVTSGIMNYKNAEKVSLRIGDAVAFKHKTYGIYPGPATGLTSPVNSPSSDFLLGFSAPITANYYWSIRPVDDINYWGSPDQRGVAVNSGDEVCIAHHVLYTTVGNGLLNFSRGNAAPFSTPSSTYKSFSWRNVTLTDEGEVFRIYKRGASPGDPITVGDEIYLHIYNGLLGNSYAGSSNLAYSGETEIYFYVNGPATTAPPNLDSELTWIVDDILVDGHTTAHTGFIPDVRDLDTAGWPVVDDLQF